MSGELLQMARSGITLLPGEAMKVAAAYDKLRKRLQEVEAERDAAREALVKCQGAT